MVKNGIKLLIVPPGGWFFFQAIENGSPYKIEDQTYDRLEDKVFSFRLSNVEIIPTGTATRESVQEDLRNAICSRAPNQCTGEWSVSPTSDVKSSQASGYVIPIQRIEDWFKQIAVKEIPWKTPSRAIEAAQICSECPQNIAWKTGCAPCVDSVQKRLARYKGDRKTPLDDQLKACRIFGHHNEIAVWMVDTMSSAREAPPSNCWNI